MTRRIAAALVLAASLVAAAVGSEAARAAPPPPAAPQFRAVVEVGADGNGATAGIFEADVAPGVRYLLVAESPCSGAFCPPPVHRLTVTVNEQQVLVSEGGAPVQAAALHEGAVQDGDNRVLISAAGPPRSAARVNIFAVRTGRPPRPVARHQLQFRGRAVVDADGNGALAARFPTTVAAPRYAIALDPVCTSVRCAPPAQEVEVQLNGEVVATRPGRERAVIELAPPGAGDNALVVTARGQPGSAVRVRIFAVSPIAARAAGNLLPEVDDQVL